MMTRSAVLGAPLSDDKRTTRAAHEGDRSTAGPVNGVWIVVGGGKLGRGLGHLAVWSGDLGAGG